MSSGLVAHGYNYSCNKIELWINFQRNLMSWEVTGSWGLDGCVRWRKVTITVAIKLNWGLIVKGIH